MSIEGCTVADGMRILRDVQIPMDDGVALRADVFLPMEGDAFPVVTYHTV
jgi:predicted acyl esterase